jgi:hypothetical protein
MRRHKSCLSDRIRQNRYHDTLTIRDNTSGVIRCVPGALDLKVHTAARLDGAPVVAVPRLNRAKVDVAGADVGVAVADEVDAVGDTTAEEDSVADLVAPDALRVGLVARLVPGDGRADGDRVRGPKAGWL